MGIHTGVFLAMWEAIDNWGPLKETFQRKFRSDAEIEMLEKRAISPADIGSKAAISLHSQAIDLTLRTNSGQEWPVAIRIDVYVKLNRYLHCHDVIEESISAIYKSHKTDQTATYIEQSTCGPPVRVSSVTVSKKLLGESKDKFPVWNGSAVVLFSIKKNPFGS